jgi:hypothetical protein
VLLFSGTALAVPVSGQGSWETTLQARDFDGDSDTAEAFYDTVLGITWLADMNYAQTTGQSVTGRLGWSTAVTWAEGLDINGFTNWRLPETGSVDGGSFDTVVRHNGTSDVGTNVSAPGTAYAGSLGSEMAHLFYNTLGNLSFCDPLLSGSSCVGPQTGWGLSNTGPFDGLIEQGYWSSTEFGINDAWIFELDDGYQRTTARASASTYYSMLVHAGDIGTAIGTAPTPGVILLLAAGLPGLAWARTRRKG